MSATDPISHFMVVSRLRAGVDRYLADWDARGGRPVFVVDAEDAQVLDLPTALAHMERLMEMNVAAALVPVAASNQPPVTNS